MSPARAVLPQLAGGSFITDGGIETDLIFHRGLELPHFAAFVLLDDPVGRQALRAYYADYVALAREHDLGVVLDTPTWRASADWGELLGYSPARLADVNRRAVSLLAELRTDAVRLTISGCLGPRGDGYRPTHRMSADAAQRYHTAQVEVLASTPAELVTALTLSYAEEAIGIVRAAAAAGIPAVVSFTVETDGRLPDGQPVAEAIETVDTETDGAAAYFMINCAHPKHFAHVLAEGGTSIERIRGLRANASAKSHAELDASDELDEGDPEELAEYYLRFTAQRPQLTVLGGCCGTDHRHLEAICRARHAAL